MLKTQFHVTMKSGLLVVLSVLFLLSISSCKQQRIDRPSGPERSVMLREGDYLSTAYIDELKRTRSPLKACPPAEYRVDLVTVQKNGDLWHLMPIYNFHEGGEAFVLHPDGSIDANNYASHVTLSVKDTSSFRLGFDNTSQHFKPTDYVFVQDATAYIARAILAGSYRDQRGHVYRFQEDGTAIFPNRKFKYEIGVDHILTGFDYFMEMGPNGHALSSVAFKWEAGSLELFRVKEDENGFDTIIGDHPYLSLQAAQ